MRAVALQLHFCIGLFLRPSFSWFILMSFCHFVLSGRSGGRGVIVHQVGFGCRAEGGRAAGDAAATLVSDVRSVRVHHFFGSGLGLGCHGS
jgi:hypothetical protein